MGRRSLRQKSGAERCWNRAYGDSRAKFVARLVESPLCHSGELFLYQHIVRVVC